MRRERIAFFTVFPPPPHLTPPQGWSDPPIGTISFLSSPPLPLNPLPPSLLTGQREERRKEGMGRDMTGINSYMEGERERERERGKWSPRTHQSFHPFPQSLFPFLPPLFPLTDSSRSRS